MICVCSLIKSSLGCRLWGDLSLPDDVEADDYIASLARQRWWLD